MKTIGWNGNNRTIIAEFIEKNRCDNCKTKPVAVFDWDNTVVFNDIGDYFFSWMLEHDLFKYPDWKKASPYLTDEAVTIIKENCPDESGFIKGSDHKCFQILTDIYVKGTLPDGSAAFTGFDPDLYQPAYAFLSHLLAGYSVKDLEILCEQAVKEAVQEEEVLIYPEMQWLIDELFKTGFDVWIISASPQILVETFAKRAGIDPKNVVGVRNVTENGLLTYDLKGCGPFRDKDNRMMTYRIGKRCWMNELIFGITGTTALLPAEDLSKRPLFAAGDSDTDVHFMMDAKGLRLLINRNKPEITKMAVENIDRLWIINEPFIKKMR
ncbi:haloacid dehalogenase-like hydrolase [bacterium]|nr:haloacid dehalogenase-like hydrolase [bacterium]